MQSPRTGGRQSRRNGGDSRRSRFVVLLQLRFWGVLPAHVLGRARRQGHEAGARRRSRSTHARGTALATGRTPALNSGGPGGCGALHRLRPPCLLRWQLPSGLGRWTPRVEQGRDLYGGLFCVKALRRVLTDRRLRTCRSLRRHLAARRGLIRPGTTGRLSPAGGSMLEPWPEGEPPDEVPGGVSGVLCADEPEVERTELGVRGVRLGICGSLECERDIVLVAPQVEHTQEIPADEHDFWSLLSLAKSEALSDNMFRPKSITQAIQVSWGELGLLRFHEFKGLSLFDFGVDPAGCPAGIEHEHLQSSHSSSSTMMITTTIPGMYIRSPPRRVLGSESGQSRRTGSARHGAPLRTGLGRPW